MINVLINAYAVSPTWGSEPGMGWNWVSNLAKYCNLHIITEGEWKEEIEVAMNNLENADRLHFHYINVSPEIREMCWNQGTWKFYQYYREWRGIKYSDFDGGDQVYYGPRCTHAEDPGFRQGADRDALSHFV